MSKIKLQPLGDMIVIEPYQTDDVTPSGIIIPESSKSLTQRGKVLAVGEGRYLESGTLIPPKVRVDDEVIFAKYGGSMIKLDDKEVIFLKEFEIKAVVQND